MPVGVTVAMSAGLSRFWTATAYRCASGTFAFFVLSRDRVQVCNCTMCTKKGFEHLIKPPGDCNFITPPVTLSEYRFGTHTARHLFCPVCGICSFYVPRSNPYGFSLNLRCLDVYDSPAAPQLPVDAFDGRSDWEAHAKTIAHLSKE